MSEWKECKLGTVCAHVLTGGTPLTKKTKYHLNGKIPWLKTKEVNFCRINNTENYISELGLANSSAKLVPANSVIIAMYGQGDTAGRVAINKIPLTTNQACCNLVIDNHSADYQFIYYLLKNSYFELVQRKTGSAQPNLNTKLIKDFDIYLPPLPEQRAIASVLSSLDDKIDLLHRQNKTLEAMAETLFRQCFVEDTNNKLKIDKLGSYVSVIDNRGKTPPHKNIKTDYPIIEVNALTGEDRLVDYTVIRKYVDKDTYINWFRGHPKKYDSLISTVGSIGEISMFLVENGTIAQNVIALTPKIISPFYLYQFLKYLRPEIKELDIGSVQPSIKVPHLLSMDFVLPKKEKMNKFDEQVIGYLSKMEVNHNQIRTLEKLRDTLLPKLMSGEVRVNLEQQEACI